MASAGENTGDSVGSRYLYRIPVHNQGPNCAVRVTHVSESQSVRFTVAISQC